MENLVFVEILRRGYRINRDVFYYQTRNKKEVDFVLKKGVNVEELIQVCYEINNFEVRKREIKSLFEASEELKCNNLSIITWDYEAEDEFKGKKIKFIPLWKWLLT